MIPAVPLYQTGFWSHKNYLQDSDSSTFSQPLCFDDASTKVRIQSESSGLLSYTGDNSSEIRRVKYTTITTNGWISGETAFKDVTNNYRSTYFMGMSGFQVDNSKLISLGSTNGIELHSNVILNSAYNVTSDAIMTFIYNSTTYKLTWNSGYDGARLINVSDYGTNLIVRNNSNLPPSSTLFRWSTIKSRVFTSGNNLYVKFVGSYHGQSDVIAYAKIAGTGSISGISLVQAAIGNTMYYLDNLSLYRINSLEATTYANVIDSDISGSSFSNDFAPFQRILFCWKSDWDLSGGIGWKNSIGTTNPSASFADITDGNDSTFGVATTNPIGMILNTTSSVNLGSYVGKWYYRSADNASVTGNALPSSVSIGNVNAFLHKVSDSNQDVWILEASGSNSVSSSVLCPSGMDQMLSIGIDSTKVSNSGISTSSTSPTFTIKLA